LSSRYIAYSLYLPVAMVYLVPMIIEDWIKRSRAMDITRYLGPVLATLVIVGAAEPVPKMLELAQALSASHRVGKSALMMLDVFPDNPLIAQLVYPAPYRVKEFAPVLNEMGYLHPPLIKTNNAALLKDPNAGPDSVLGSIERSTRVGDSDVAQSG